MSGFLYQIEAKQALLKQHYSEVQKVKKVPLVLVASEPGVATGIAKEKMIAVALPEDLHVQADALMKSLDIKGSKREFIRDVLSAAFRTLSM